MTKRTKQPKKKFKMPKAWIAGNSKTGKIVAGGNMDLLAKSLGMKKKDSDFSKFFREATPEEKRKVYMEVVREANKEQRKVMEEAKAICICASHHMCELMNCNSCPELNTKAKPAPKEKEDKLDRLLYRYTN